MPAPSSDVVLASPILTEHPAAEERPNYPVYRSRRSVVGWAEADPYRSVASYSGTDFRADLNAFDISTLVIHGEDDQVVPFAVGGKKSAAAIANAMLKMYPGAPHGLPVTHTDQVNRDLLDFLKQ